MAVSSTLSNLPEQTVSEISGAIKRNVEETFSYVRVRGELGRVSRPASGHVYLDLKDDRAVLSGVIWKGVAARIGVQLEQGLEVVASGKITTFPGQSKYQIVIDAIEPAGAGALLAQLEERRKRLAAEGLFDQARKQLLPEMPRIIGVVTSPTGAVIRDILHRLRDRFPVHVLVWPCRVQGEGAAEEIAAGIRGFNAMAFADPIPRPDVLIVGRGGGSLEDLWAFNEEIVVRAAADSDIPLISAVGHETDTTLIDFASDRRAPTPTAAAEMAVPVRTELISTIGDRQARLLRALIRLTGDRRREFIAAARGLPRLEDLLALPRQRLDVSRSGLLNGMRRQISDRRQHLALLQSRMPRLRDLAVLPRRRLDELSRRFERSRGQDVRDRRAALDRAVTRLKPILVSQRVGAGRRTLAHASQAAVRAQAARVSRARARLDQSGKLLAALGYSATLSRGYALARDADGNLIRSTDAARKAGEFGLSFADGQVDVRVTDKGGGTSQTGAGSAPARTAQPEKKASGTAGQVRRQEDKAGGGQGSLF
ncbi:MAG: exodeoxyribonuclease VII large subunit [Pseudomonadota bacterium]